MVSVCRRSFPAANRSSWSCARATSCTCGRPETRPHANPSSRSRGNRIWHPKVEAREQIGNRLRPDLEPVTGCDGTELSRFDRAEPAHFDQLVEVLLESAGRDDLQDSRRLVGRVPEGVPLIARLVDEVARVRDHYLVAKKCAQSALEDEAVLVLARVQVQRGRERPRRHRVLHERELAARLRAVDHEADADPAERSGLAIRGSDHLCHYLLLSLDTPVLRIHTPVATVCQYS